MFLAAFAGITCLMGASIGTILQTDAGRARILHLLEERVPSPCRGYAPPESHDGEVPGMLTRGIDA